MISVSDLPFLILGNWKVVLLCLGLTLLFWKRQRRKYVQEARDYFDEIPGPPPATKEHGNFPDIVRAGSLHHFLEEVHGNHGDVVKIWFGERPVVSTATSESFKDQTRLFDKPDMSFLVPVFGERSIQFVNGEEARTRRRNYDDFLRHHAVDHHFHLFSQIITEFVEEKRKLPNGTEVNVYENMFHLACKAVGIALFGDYFQDNQNVDKFRNLYETFWPILETNFTSGLPPEGSKERQHFDKVTGEVHDVARQLIAARAHRTDWKLIDVIMETGHDDITVLGDILVYLVGGFHSTSIVLTWCLYHAAKYPETQQKIRSELSDVLGGSDVTKSSLHKLVYLKQFINETLRLRFVAPIAIRTADGTTTICGYKIPKNTQIIQALGVAMKSSKSWTDPDRFEPERFNRNNDDEQITPKLKTAKQAHLAFCPFGFAGKRMCPGKTFFYDEALVYLSSMFIHFEFFLQDRDSDLPVTYGLLTRPAVDVLLNITHRENDE